MLVLGFTASVVTVGVLFVSCCIMVNVMIEAPHPVHTLTRLMRSSLYIYNALPGVLLVSCLDGECYDCEAPHQVHTLMRLSLSIYNVLLRLLLWLAVIRMQTLDAVLLCLI
jgi:hypothetical protein